MKGLSRSCHVASMRTAKSSAATAAHRPVLLSVVPGPAAAASPQTYEVRTSGRGAQPSGLRIPSGDSNAPSNLRTMGRAQQLPAQVFWTLRPTGHNDEALYRSCFQNFMKLSGNHTLNVSFKNYIFHCI